MPKTHINTKNTKMNTKWLNNALRSIGVTSKASLKSMAPNISDAVSTGAKTSKNLITNIKSSKNGIDGVMNTLRTNRYVSIAEKAYNNALADLKSGNFNNTAREEEYQEKLLFGDSFNIDDFDDSDFSFGDDDEPANVNVNQYVDTGSSDAVIALSRGVEKQTETMVKTNKASMDAYIAVSSAAMLQNEKIGSEVISHLSNISNSLEAMVEYNNENMTRFIESSIAFYERMGGGEKVSGSGFVSLFDKGYTKDKYKSKVLKSIEKQIGPELQMLKGMDPDTIEALLTANPLGFASSLAMDSILPKIVGNSVQHAEKAFTNAIPTVLSKINDFADEMGTGLVNKLKRKFGQIFGYNIETKSALSASIERGPIPFDGETKHAITEIITKELREQTGYLKYIATKFGADPNKVIEQGQVWDATFNRYTSVGNIKDQILESVHDAVLRTFKDEDFGKDLYKMTNNVDNYEDSKSLEKSIDELVFALTESKKHIEFGDMKEGSEYKKIYDRLVAANPGNKKNFDAINEYVKQMAVKNPTAYRNFTPSLLNAKNRWNNQLQYISENPYEYNLFASGLNNNSNFRNIFNEKYGYGKHGVGKNNLSDSFVNPEYTTDGRTTYGIFQGAVDGFRNASPGSGTFREMAGAGIASMKRQMGSVISGDYKGGVKEFMNMVLQQTGLLFKGFKNSFLTPLKTSLFGIKDENGYAHAGIFSGVQNSMKDFVEMMKHNITGKEYVDSQGNRHEATSNSVYANLSKISSSIKIGVMEKLFGKNKVDKDGNTTGEDEERTGILSKITSTFSEGFRGWQEAFFGKIPNEEERTKLTESIKNKLKEHLPDTLTGTALGAGVGMLSGGGLLGTLIGGPIGGAAIGTAIGFLHKSDKFQKILFGEDVDGKKVGGIVSDKVQKFFKDNKNKLIGGSAVGAVTGTLGISGGGILGTLVGGPIAGALTGLGSSIILSSERFQKVLHGDEKTGRKGIINAVKDAFNSTRNRQNTLNDEAINDKKLAGMSILGTGAGALSAALISKMGVLGAALTPLGPIGGALAGLGLSISAQSGKFKSWLFGSEEDDPTDPNKKRKKQGVLGQFANILRANVFQPIIDESKYQISRFGNSIYNGIETVGLAAEYAAGRFGEWVKNSTEDIRTKIADVTTKIGEGIKTVFQPITSAVGKIATSTITIAGHYARKFIDIPTKLLKGALTIFTSTILEKGRKIFDDIKEKLSNSLVGKIAGGIKEGIKDIAKGAFGVATTPLRWAGQGISSFANKVESKANSIRDERNKSLMEKAENAGNLSENATWSEKLRALTIQQRARTAELDLSRSQARAHNKNAQLIAKYTNGQYGTDSVEAREYLKSIDPRAYEKLNLKVDASDAKIVAIQKKQAEDNHANTAIIKDESKKQTELLQNIHNDLQGKNGKASISGAASIDNQSAENLKKVRDAGKTVAEQKAEKEKEEQKATLERIADSVSGTRESTEEHASNWSSIFGKKGLITGALILGAPLIFKAFKWLLTDGKSIISSIAKGIGVGVGGAGKDAAWTYANDAGTNGESMGDAALNEASTFLLDENGNVNHGTYARVKGYSTIGRKVGKKAWKNLNKAYDVIENGKVGKTKFGKFTKDKFENTYLRASYARESMQISNFDQTRKRFTAAIENTANGKGKAGEILTKAKKYIGEFFDNVLTKLSKKFGKSGAKLLQSGTIKSIKKTVLTVIEKGSSKLVPRLTGLLGTTAALAATGVGLLAKEITWVTLGAVNGVTGAARLFQVDSEYVDWKMRIISTAIGALAGTTVGSVVDIVNEVAAGITGVDFLTNLACAIYTVVSSDEDSKKLQEGRDAFKNKYVEYKDSKIEEAYEQALADGTIDPEITLDEFKQGVKDGTYKAEYQSFIDYNDSEHKTLGAKIGSGLKKIGDAVFHPIDTAKKIGASKIVKSALITSTSIGRVTSGTINLATMIFKSPGKAWFDSVGGYYLAKGKEYAYYNPNGDYLYNVNAETVNNQIKSGLLTQGKLNIKQTAKTNVTSIGQTISSAWDKAKSVVSSAWGKFKNWVTGGNNTSGGNGKGSSISQINKNGVTSLKFMPNMNGARGGRGPEKLNGFDYYSQNDPRWKSIGYNMGNDGATIGDSGCGPAAMSMVTSQMTGKDVDPTQMANFAKMTGDRDETGTNWSFVNKAAGAYGLSTTESINPSANFIDSQLSQGKPMILSGTSNGNKSAYTPAGHYVVAVGKDNNGNAIINDPRGKGYSGKYDIDSLAYETGAAWSFGNGGYGNTRRKRGGHGLIDSIKKKFSKKVQCSASQIIALAKTQIGVSEDPVKSDNVKYNKELHGGAKQPWCCTFIRWLFKQLKAEKLFCDGRNEAAVPNVTAWARKSKQLLQYNKGKPGDLAIFDWSGGQTRSDHIGLIIGVENGYYITIEGNTSDPNGSGNEGVYQKKRSFKQISYVVRPLYNGASSVDISDIAGADASIENAQSSSNDILGTIGSFFSEAGSRLFKGVASGNFDTDYSSFWSGQNSSNSEDGTDTSVGSANVNSSLGNARNVWDYFTQNGYSKAATAGILGNMYAESGVNPMAVQKGRDGKPVGPAAGLVQWERYRPDGDNNYNNDTGGGRFAALQKYAKNKGKNWTDLGSQLEFINKELQSLHKVYWVDKNNMKKAGTTGTDFETWRNSNDIETATRQFEGAFERAGIPRMNVRIDAAKKYYKKFNGGGSGEGIPTIAKRKSYEYKMPTTHSGGFGIETGSTMKKAAANSKNAYKVAKNASKYITTTTSSTEKELMMNMISILSEIAINTLSASEKLELLKTLENIGGNNIIMPTQASSSNQSTDYASPMIAKSKSMPSRNAELAKRIARGV